MKRIACLGVVIGLLAVPGLAAGAVTTIGSLAPPYSGPQTGVSRFQASEFSGPSYGVPANDTLTKFRVQFGDATLAGSGVRFVVVRPNGGGSYSIVHRTTTFDIEGRAAGSVGEFPVSLAVLAGDRIGMEASGGQLKVGWDPGTGSSTDLMWPTGATVGGNEELDTPFTPTSSFAPARLNLEADLGFPDVPTPPTGNPQPPAFTDTVAPIFTQFKTAYKRWRYKPKGAAVSKRAHPGTTFSMNISEPATVQFTVTKAFRGKITKGICKKAGRTNRKNRRCTKLIQVHQFSRQAFVGVNRWPYSGRYLDAKGRVGSLRPGPYKLTAVATDAAGNASAPQTIGFTIVR